MILRKLIKMIVRYTYRPALLYYLRKDRLYEKDGLKILVRQGVFHPQFFFSTKFLLKAVINDPLKNKKVLELGAGSGYISCMIAKKGAVVTATDINPVAVDGLEENMRVNFSGSENSPRVILSDLFTAIPAQTFDYILVNPPYYPSDPLDDAQKAWYCGTGFRYFQQLFDVLKGYMHGDTKVLMSLSDECDIKRIEEIALRCDLNLKLLLQEYKGWERQYIYQVL